MSDDNIVLTDALLIALLDSASNRWGCGLKPSAPGCRFAS